MSDTIPDPNTNQTIGTLDQPSDQTGVEQAPYVKKPEEDKKKKMQGNNDNKGSSKSTAASWLAALIVASALVPNPVQAMEEKAAIEKRPELSQFNSLLDQTGNASVLNQGRYTVFAPVNGSFNKYPAASYPYLYNATLYPDAQAWTSNIVRNHIVPGEVYLGDVVGRKGGVFAINDRFVHVAEGPTGTFYVDGHKVLSQRMLTGGILYEIDGVISKPWELVEVLPPAGVATVASVPDTIVLPENGQVIVEDTDSNGVRTTTVISSVQ